MERCIAGLLVGVAVALVTVLMPVVGVILILVGLVAGGVLLVRQTRGGGSAMYLAAALIGAGALFFVGVVNTTASCYETVDFCGHANVVPLLVLAVVAIAVGSLIAIRGIRRS